MLMFVAIVVVVAILFLILLLHFNGRKVEPFNRGIGESLLGRMLGPTGGGCCADQSSILADSRPGEYNPMRQTWSERPSELAEIGTYRPSDEEKARLNE